jgi:2-polyprenyl-3-methyl-5-hydroxy-6-metoxy-1,4-benzoquinol methylase
MPYLFTHEDKAERERLASIEASLDPFTIECLEKIGVKEGWRCLEVGAGGGSIAAWLCRRVGLTGRVVATDLQTKFLEAIEAPNLEVRRHDITAEALEPDAFDLVCARKVLEHLAAPATALRRMYAALRPGGWLLVEDSDLASFRRVSCPRPDLFERAYSKFLDVMSAAGFQPTLGIRLGDELRAVGLAAVQVKGLTGEWTAAGDHPVGKVYRMTFERLRERVTGQGLLTQEEVDQFLAEIQSPDFHAITGVHVAAWGRKPG